MIAYKNIKQDEITYNSIERFVKKTSTHPNVMDTDTAYIANMFNESIKLH